MTSHNLIAHNLTAGTVDCDAAVAAAKADHERELAALRTELKTANPARRKRKVSLSVAITQAKKAGEAVAGATIAVDGSVTLSFSKVDAATTNGSGSNPWDEVFIDEANEKRPTKAL